MGRRRGGHKKKGNKAVVPLPKGPPPPEVTPEESALERQGAQMIAIFPAEIWEMILEQVGPEDQENLSNASLFFRSHFLSLRADFLFPSVIKVLLHNSYNIGQGAADLLNFRRVSRSWNSGVVALCQDPTPKLEFLEEKRSGHVGPWKPAIIRKLDTSYVLRQADVARFLDHFQATHGPTHNPFLSRHLTLSLITFCLSDDHSEDPEEPEISPRLDLMDRYGGHVVHLKVLVKHHCPDYEVIYFQLACILRRAHNLRTLQLRYPNTPRHRESEPYRLPGARTFDQLDKDAPARPIFQRLEQLALFYVPACILTRVSVHSTNLTELTIKSEEDWSSDKLATVLIDLTNLQILSLDLRKSQEAWKRLDFLVWLRALQSLTLTLGVSSRLWGDERQKLLRSQGHKFRFLDYFHRDEAEGPKERKDRARRIFELWPDLKVYTFKLALMWGEGEAKPEPPGFRKSGTKRGLKQEEGAPRLGKVDVKV